MLKTFGWAIGVSVLALVGAFLIGGPQAFVLVAILGVLEISLSFDNAVVNATVLVRMNAFWQKLFLSVGIIIAVFGMRLLFPLLIVGITASLNPVDVIDLALKGGAVDDPGTYASYLSAAHPSIAAFGGMFLFMLFLDFVFEEREIAWLAWLERPLARIGKLDQLSVVVALSVLTVCAKTLAEKPVSVMVSGVLGVVAYVLVNGLGELFESDEDGDEEDGPPGIHGDSETVAAAVATPTTSTVGLAGRAAFFLFLYLELLDASFSFDGVIGAFAITQDIFIIATGLGIGAMFIRSLTVFLVRKGTLSEYVYLEHGANWAIGALSIILLLSIEYEIPEIVTGLVGIAFIGAAFLTSWLRNRHEEAADTAASTA